LFRLHASPSDGAVVGHSSGGGQVTSTCHAAPTQVAVPPHGEPGKEHTYPDGAHGSPSFGAPSQLGVLLPLLELVAEELPELVELGPVEVPLPQAPARASGTATARMRNQREAFIARG
jgi:hypothetical protein